MQKRGQAATEFLTTYGWVILIIIVIAVALASLNVFKAPDIPSTCDSNDPIFCSDVLLEEDSDISLVLSASGTSSADVIEINLDSPISANCDAPSGGGMIDSGVQNTISCNSWNPLLLDLDEGDRFTGTAKIEYSLEEAQSLIHTIEIPFSGTVEGSGADPLGTYTVVISFSGGGTGRVTSDRGSIDCTEPDIGTCSFVYDENVIVVLTAFEGVDSELDAWKIDSNLDHCPVSDDPAPWEYQCAVTINEDLDGDDDVEALVKFVTST